MAVRIQLRRDTAANWIASNPVLRAGEFGVETDTLKIKVGNGSSNWNSISNYLNVVPTELSSYIAASEKGAANGVASLDSSSNLIVPGSSIIVEGSTANEFELTLTAPDVTEDKTVTLPNATTTLVGTDTLDTLTNKTITSPVVSGLTLSDASIVFEGAVPDSYETTLTVGEPTDDRIITLPNATGTIALTSDITSAINALSTTDIEEGTNKYFTDELAQDAVAAAIAAGTHTNITITYNDNDNTLSFTGAVTYTDENAQDAVASALAAGTHSNISVSYNDNGNSISLSGSSQYTDEMAQDAVGNAVGNGLDYNDETGAISVDPSEFALSSVGAPTTDVSMATYKITNLGTPTQSTDAATKAYVDSVSEGLHIHEAVHATTTESLNATYNNGTNGVGATLIENPAGALIVDGHEASVGDRILVKNQSTASQNGIYVVTDSGSTVSPYILTRATDFDTGSEISGGDFVFVENGTLYNSTGWVLENEVVTVGTDPIVWIQFSGAGTYLAGNGLTLTGNTFSINTGVTVDLSTTQTLTNKTITGTFTGNITGDVTGNVSGNAGTVTNGVYTNGSYSNPTWITGLAWSKISSTPTSLSGYGITDPIVLTSSTYSDPTWITSLSASKVGLGNVENTALSTWAGSTNITTLGTIGTGTWNATAIGTTKGGTGLTSYAAGDIIYASASDTLAKLAKGTDGQILTLASGVPSWAAAPITLPSQEGNSGKYLTTDGTTASWGTLVVPITTGTATITANTATTIDTNALAGFTSVEYMISLKQGSKVRTSKVIMQTDGTSVDMTEFAITETGGTMSGVVVSATASAGNALLQVTVTDAASTNVTVKFSEVKL